MRRPPPARPLLLSLIAHGWLALHGGGSSFANDSLRYDVRAELGGEYDSNAHRSETVDGVEHRPIVASPLARAAIGAHLSDVVAPRQQLALSAMLAGKLFTAPAARSEDVAIAQSSGLWRLAIGARTAISAQGVYYEAFQPGSSDPASADERRDFRSLTPQLQLERWLAPGTALVAGVGYRWFVFKSDLSLDFQAPVASLELRWTREAADGGADWELAAGVSLERRAFDGAALTRNGSVAATAMPPSRRDNFLVNHLDLTRVGTALVGVGYALHLNRSNSFGETLTRHLVTLRLTTPLPLALYLAARAELIIASYRDAVTVGMVPTTGQLLSIDDENRSSLRVDLSRALSADGRVLLLARYTVYVNELGVSGAATRYRRQTALLSLAFTIDNL